jgi:ABC-type antimicrobial peptide transport system permease subunit
MPNVNPPTLQWRTIVGMVGHVHHSRLDQLGREQVYVPLAQTTFPILNMYLTVRAAGDPSSLANILQAQVHAIDPALPVYDLKPMELWVDSTAALRRFTMILFVAFGVLALLLAGIGTYGVMAYAVGQRRQEIGIRLALGATRVGVVRLIVTESLRLGAAGVGLGLAFAFVAASGMSTLLYGVEPHDPATLAGVCVILVAVAIAAALVPAQRATRVNPMQTMRSE